MKPAGASLTVLSLLLCYTTAAAQTNPNARSDAQLLAASCNGCHADNQPADHTMPNLGILSAAEINKKLLSYRNNKLTGTVMNRISKGYTEAEIEQLAKAIGRSSP